jgi:hypothetical protein
MVGSGPEAAWGTCRYCGTAVAPDSATCGLCGADRPIGAGALGAEPVGVRRRVAFTNGLRTLVVVGVALALAVTLVGAVLTGPPNVADPLTTSGTYAVRPGSSPILSGAVTGGDFVVGNFTSVRPFGANVTLSVYNASEWALVIGNGTGTPAWSTPSEGSGRIIFTAPYTDTYVFVLTNPYPEGTQLTITVYVTTQYESNVGDDGFG